MWKSGSGHLARHVVTGLGCTQFIWWKSVDGEEQGPTGSLEELQDSKFKKRRMNVPRKQRSFQIFRRKAEECGMSEAEGEFSVLLLQYFCKPEIISKYKVKNHFVRAY